MNERTSQLQRVKLLRQGYRWRKCSLQQRAIGTPARVTSIMNPGKLMCMEMVGYKMIALFIIFGLLLSAMWDGLTALVAVALMMGSS
jgi:hypothetical protein